MVFWYENNRNHKTPGMKTMEIKNRVRLPFETTLYAGVVFALWRGRKVGLKDPLTRQYAALTAVQVMAALNFESTWKAIMDPTMLEGLRFATNSSLKYLGEKLNETPPQNEDMDRALTTALPWVHAFVKVAVANAVAVSAYGVANLLSKKVSCLKPDAKAFWGTSLSLIGVDIVSPLLFRQNELMEPFRSQHPSN